MASVVFHQIDISLEYIFDHVTKSRALLVGTIILMDWWHFVGTGNLRCWETLMTLYTNEVWFIIDQIQLMRIRFNSCETWRPSTPLLIISGCIILVCILGPICVSSYMTNTSDCWQNLHADPLLGGRMRSPHQLLLGSIYPLDARSGSITQLIPCGRNCWYWLHHRRTQWRDPCNHQILCQKHNLCFDSLRVWQYADN